MSQFLLGAAVALTVGAIVFGFTVLFTGDDRGLRRAEPDSRAVPLPADRPLVESDVTAVRFDTAARGYRMAQVDAALRRAAYDIGYKDELIKVLQAEVDALRSGRPQESEALRRAREAALATEAALTGGPGQSTGTPTRQERPAPDGPIAEESGAGQAAEQPTAPTAPEGADGPAGTAGPDGPDGAESPVTEPEPR